jgi:hypothetical protein
MLSTYDQYRICFAIASTSIGAVCTYCALAWSDSQDVRRGKPMFRFSTDTLLLTALGLIPVDLLQATLDLGYVTVRPLPTLDKNDVLFALIAGVIIGLLGFYQARRRPKTLESMPLARGKLRLLLEREGPRVNSIHLGTPIRASFHYRRRAFWVDIQRLCGSPIAPLAPLQIKLSAEENKVFNSVLRRCVVEQAREVAHTPGHQLICVSPILLDVRPDLVQRVGQKLDRATLGVTIQHKDGLLNLNRSLLGKLFFGWSFTKNGSKRWRVAVSGFVIQS